MFYNFDEYQFEIESHIDRDDLDEYNTARLADLDASEHYFSKKWFLFSMLLMALFIAYDKCNYSGSPKDRKIFDGIWSKVKLFYRDIHEFHTAIGIINADIQRYKKPSVLLITHNPLK